MPIDPKKVRWDEAAPGIQPEAVQWDDAPPARNVYPGTNETVREDPGLGQYLLNRLKAGVITPVAGAFKNVADTLAPDLGTLSPNVQQLVDVVLPQRRAGQVIGREADIAQEVAADYRNVGAVQRPASVMDALRNPADTLRYYGGIGAESAPTILGAIATRNPALANVVASGGTVAQTYGDLRQDPRANIFDALRESTIAGITEGAGGRAAFESAFAPTSLGRKVLTTSGLEALGESGSEAAQTATPALTGREDVPILAIIRAAIDAGIVGTATGAGEAVLGSRGDVPPSNAIAPTPAVENTVWDEAPPVPSVGPTPVAATAAPAPIAPPVAAMPTQPVVAEGAGTPMAAPAGEAPLPADMDIDAILAALPPDVITQLGALTAPNVAAPVLPPAPVAQPAAIPQPEGERNVPPSEALPAAVAEQRVESVPAAGVVAGRAASEAAQAQAEAGAKAREEGRQEGGQEDGAVTYTAADFLPGMGREVGWSQRGGELMRERREGDDSIENFAGRATGDVTGRTTWVAKPDPSGGESRLWRSRPDRSLNEGQAQTALEKAARGEKLRPIEQRFVDYATALAEEYAETANRESAAYRAELEQYSEADRVAQRQAARDEFGELADADADEALALDDLVHRAYAAGAQPEAILDATFDGTPAEQARNLWRMVAELESADATVPEATQRDRAVGAEAREEGRAARPQTSQPAEVGESREFETTLTDGTPVTVKLSPSLETSDVLLEVFGKDGRGIGHLWYGTSEAGAGSPRFAPRVMVDESMRRKGVATMMYRIAVDNGGLFPPLNAENADRSESGQAFREGIDRKGFDPSATRNRAAAGLFGAPSSREVVDAEARRRDAERDGRTGSGRTDMASGAGDLFAGRRPQQATLESTEQDQTQTPAFRAWFGDSKVVDWKGNPQVVYHGAINPDGGFDVFDRKAGKYATHGRSINAVGSWFTTAPGDAAAYAGAINPERAAPGGQSFPVYLSIKKPFRISSGDSMAAMWEVQAGGDDRLQNGDPDKFRQALIEQGYDGLVMDAQSIDKFAEEGSEYWVAFNPEQIKSATANRGTFDPENPSILEDVSARDRFAERRAEREAERATLPREESRARGEREATERGVRAAVEKALGPLKSRVEFVADAAGLPDNLRRGVEARLAARGGRGKTAAVYDQGTGKVYMITDANQSPERSVFTAFHELAGHHGLRTLLGDKLDSALGIARQNPTVRSVADAIAAERNIDQGKHSGIMLATEEALAELAAAVRTGNYAEIESRYKTEVPEGVRASLKRAVDNFLKRLKAAIDDIFGRHVFTDEDVRALLEHAWQAANEGPTIADVRGGMALEATARPQGLRDFLEDSKVKRVVYHATRGDFDEFDTALSDLGAHFGSAEQANHIAERRLSGDRPGQTSGVSIVPVHLRMTNPLRLKDEGSFHAWSIAKQLQRKGIIDKATAGRWESEGWRANRKNNAEAREAIKAAGHDGVVYKNTQERNEDNWIAFDPGQIKSATANRGAFDPSSPSILEAVDDMTPAQTAREAAKLPDDATGQSIIAGGQVVPFLAAAKESGADLTAVAAALRNTDPAERARELVKAIDAILPSLREEAPAPKAAPKAAPRPSTGTRNEITDAERAAAGRDPILRDAVQTNEQTLAEAMRTLKEDPAAGPETVEKLIRSGPAGVSLADEAVLLVHKTDLRNRRDTAAQKLADPNASEEAKAVAKREWESLEAQIATLDEAAVASGREWGRLGQFRQRMLRDDFTFEALERKERARLERPLTPAESQTIRDMAQNIASLQRRADAAEAQLANAASVSTYDDLIKRMADSMQGKKRPTLARLKEAANESRAALAALESVPSRKGQSGATINPVAFYHLARIGAYHVANGAATFADWVDRMRADIGEAVDTFRESLPEIFRASKVQVDKPLAAGATVAEVLAKVDRANITPKDVRRLVEAHVGEGMRGEAKVMAAVAEDLGIDVDQARKLFVQTNPRTPQTLTEAQQELRDLRRLVTLQAEIDRLEEGLPRDRAAQKVEVSGEIQAKKDEMAALRKKLSAGKVQEAREAARANTLEGLRLQAEELQRQIDMGYRPIPGEKAARPKDAAIEAAREELSQVRQRIREMDERAERDARAIDRMQSEIDRLEAGIPKPKPGEKAPDSPEVAAKRAELEALRTKLRRHRVEMRAAQREAARPVVDPEARYQVNRGKDIARRIETLQKRIAAGDFAAKPRVPRALNAANDKAQFELSKAKQDFLRHQFEDNLRNRTPVQKLFGGVKDTLNLARAMMTSLDLSGVLRQGGFITYGHPVRAAKSLVPMLKAFASEGAQHKVQREIENRANAPLYRKYGLELTGIGSGPLSQIEEAYASRWLDRLPSAVGGGLVRGSGRAYTTFLNKLRADSFDAMVASLAKGQVPTPEEGKAIANFINVATGRGKIGAKANAGEALNTIFFAPRLVASRFQLLAGQPLYGGSARTRGMIAQEYARFLAGVGVVTALAALALGDDEEPEDRLKLIGTDPRSANFGKIRFGNTYLDPLVGLAQASTLLARLTTGETVTQKGDVRPLRANYTLNDLQRALGADIDPHKLNKDGSLPFGSGSAADVIGRFLRTKLAPVPGAAVNTLSGENLIGEPVTPLQAAGELVTPMSIGNVREVMEDQGIPKGTAITLLGLLGMGVQYRKPKDEEGK